MPTHATLWNDTHATLCAGDWERATHLLEQVAALPRRARAHDFAPLSAYEAASGIAVSAVARPGLEARLRAAQTAG